MTPERVITWTRPDGTIDYHGTAIDRAPNGIPPARHRPTPESPTRCDADSGRVTTRSSDLRRDRGPRESPSAQPGGPRDPERSRPLGSNRDRRHRSTGRLETADLRAGRDHRDGAGISRRASGLRSRRRVRRAATDRVRPTRRRRSGVPRLHRRRAARGQPDRRPRRAAPLDRARQPALEQPDVARHDRARGAGPRTRARLLQRAARRVPLRVHRQRQRGAAARRRGVPVRRRRHVRPDVRQPQLGQRHPRVRPPQGRDGRLRAGGRARPARRPRRADRGARQRRPGGTATCSPSRRSRTSPACSTRSTSSPRRTTHGWDVLARRGRLRADQPPRPRRVSAPTS